MTAPVRLEATRCQLRATPTISPPSCTNFASGQSHRPHRPDGTFHRWIIYHADFTLTPLSPPHYAWDPSLTWFHRLFAGETDEPAFRHAATTLGVEAAGETAMSVRESAPPLECVRNPSKALTPRPAMEVEDNRPHISARMFDEMGTASIDPAKRTRSHNGTPTARCRFDHLGGSRQDGPAVSRQYLANVWNGMQEDLKRLSTREPQNHRQRQFALHSY